MKSFEWKTYRTRFLVKAKQLNSSLTFTDHLGRQHCGRRGDYLVESCDGVLSIAPRQIFEDIYVPMGLLSNSSPPGSTEPGELASAEKDRRSSERFDIEPISIEKIKTRFRNHPCEGITSDKPARTQRKTPEPVRLSSSRLGLM